MRLDAPRLIQCINWPNGNANQTEERETSTKKNETDSWLPHFLNRWNMIREPNSFDECECAGRTWMCVKKDALWQCVCVCVWRVSVWWIFFRRKFINAACMHVCNARIFANFWEILRVGVFVSCIRKTGKDINLNRKVLFWSLSLFCATIPYSAA